MFVCFHECNSHVRMVCLVNVLFPFLAFMIEDMGHGGHELGYYAGGLAAAFCGAQFSSSVIWGAISDNYGRKPAVFLGTLGTAAGMLIFGTAKSYWQAVLGRIVGGILCGNLGVVKSFLSEITDETNQGKGFSYLSIAWSLGSLLAPLAGGLLCSPAEKYPAYFSKDGLFGYYPYLLPCLICVVNNVLTAFFCLAVMRETRKFKKPAKSTTKTVDDAHTANPMMSKYSQEVEMTAVSTSTSTSTTLSIEDDPELTTRRGLSRTPEEAAKFSIVGDDEDEDDTADNGRHPHEDVRSMFLASDINYSEVAIGEEDSDEEAAGPRSSSEGASKTSSAADQAGLIAHEDEDHDDNEEDFDESDLCCVNNNSNAPWFSCCATPSSMTSKRSSGGRGDTDVEFGSSSSHGLTVMSDGAQRGKQLSANSKRALVLRQRTVLMATGNYGILAMAYILFDETIPLFLKLSKAYGGLEFTSSQIGFLLSISGGAMLGFNYYLLPYFITRTSKKSMFEWGIIGSIPFALMWPVMALLNAEVLVPKIHNATSYWAILWPVLIFVCLLKNVFACLSFTAVMLQINHSVYEEYLGAVNGLGQSLASLARAFGPALGGMLWSISIQRKFVFLNFLSVITILIVSAFINRQLPESINHKKRRKHKHGDDDGHDAGGGGMIMH